MSPTETHQAVVADVGAQRVARVYAEAILNAASAHNQVDEVRDDLDSLINDVFNQNPQVEVYLTSPVVGRDRKASVIRDAFDGKATEVLVNFLLVLNNHDRLDLLRPIRAAYRDLYDERAKRVRVLVRSAVPLEDDQLERLRQQMRQSFHLEPVVEARVDPDLIGGMVVRVGDWLFDASIRSRLELIRNQLFERSSHEIQSRRDRCSIDA